MSITHSTLLVLLVLITNMRDNVEAGNLGPFIPGDGVALLHQEFRLRCDNLDLTLDRGNVSYLWFRNSSLMSSHSSHVLLFPNVTEADQGNYTCAVRDVENGILSPHSSPVTLRAYSSKIHRPHIRPVNVAVINQPLDFILVCDMADSYTSSGDVTFAWFKEGTLVLEQPSPVLHFSPVREEDGGVYTCTVKDGGDTSPPSEAFLLTPLVSPEVCIGLKLSDHVIKGILEENLTLTCEVIRAFPEVPADGFSWSYLPSPQGPRRPLVGKTSTLTLGPLTREDAGQYFCQARNNPHFRELSGSNGAVTVHIIYLQNITLTSDLEVKEGHPVTLTCSVDSLPAARLAWIVHGQEVRHVIDNLDHYVIPRAGCSDSTRYTCRASNTDLPGREMSASTRLKVLPCNTGVDSSQGVDPTWRTALIVVLCILALFPVILVVIWQRNRLARCLRRATRRLQSLTAGNKDAMYGTLHDVQIEMEEEHPNFNPTDALLESYEQEIQSTDVTGQLLLQGRRQDFQALYQRRKVYVIPPLPAQQPSLEGGQADLGRLGQEEAKVCVLRLLRDKLEDNARFHDSPVFVFTQALPLHMHAVIYHSSYGVIIVKTEVVSQPNSSILRKAARQLGEARQKVEEELRDLLEPEAVTLLLALPNLENRGDFGDPVREQLDDRDIHLLFGRKADVDTWNQLPFTWVERPACWNQPECYQAFVTAVSRHLCMEDYSHSQTEGRHTRLLATPEQAAVLHCTDKLLHIWGPPGSGKTLLVLDRTRQWLRNGKTVVVAVCSPDCQLLLHRLGRESLLRLTRDTASRLKLCCNPGELKKTLQKLGQQRPPSSICIIIDHIDCQIYSVLLEASRSAAVECVWTTGQRDFPAKVSDQLHSLGGRSVLLPHPLRCHPDLLPLARELLPPRPLTPDLTDPPCLPARLPPASVKVTLHPFHPDYRALEQDSSAFDCEDCSEWLTSSLSSLVERLPLEEEQWRHWVILLTGDWGSGSRVMKLVTWLRQQGVPAVREWKSEHRVSRLPAASLMDPSRYQGSEVSKNRATFRARVLSGEDREGRPAVHVIPVSHFTGLEKARVLAVHYDWKDDHPDHQSQKKRDAILSRHRDQLFQAVTRCQTELAVWLLSPSPAASLLQGHEVEATAAAEQTASQADQAPSPAAAVPATPPASPPTVAAPAAAPAAATVAAAAAPAATAPAPEVGPAVAAPSPVAVARSNVQ